MISSSVDGIVKIWNVKKAVCVNTFEMHEEKVWALDTCGKYIVTGAADSHLKLWLDNTMEEEYKAKQIEVKRVQDEHAISSMIMEKDFSNAALLAFKINKNRDLYMILK